MRWVRDISAAALAAALLACAGAQGLAGTFEGPSEAGTVTVEFVVSGDTLTGKLVGPGLSFALEGRLSGEDGYGTVHTALGTAAFEAYVQGDLLGLYLFEVDAAGEPVMDSVIELVLTRRAVGGALGQLTPGRQVESATVDEVIAVGEFASLSRDNATAFIEALEFVLAQIGYVYQFTEADRQELLNALALNFPSAEQVDQVVMAEARTIWERVKANWPEASEEDRREFALGVLVLAFGEDTVAAWVGVDDGAAGGQASAGGQPLGSGQCATFEDCTGSFVDGQTWSDTFNTQGCWAAAGCSSFDSSTSSFDYGDY